MNAPLLPTLLGLVAVFSPALLLVGLGVPSLLGRPLSERLTDRLGQAIIWTGLLAAISVLIWMLSTDQTHLLLVGRNWVEIPGYHFAFKLVFDRLSVPFVILSFLLCGTIGAFAARYLHREPGFNRFFVLFSIFLLGMIVTSLAGTIETLFAGWELVGLSSALLVAFYHERLGPVSNGLHVWTVYRVSDAALLMASVVLHFSGWLPRAMEGPTPSSAVLYGALSVHLGAYLLLRVSPLLDASPPLCIVVVALGLLTSAHAVIVGRAQTDIKTALTYASMTQVGLIVAEIGMGFRYLALAHILGHACWRTLQFLRAPTFLHDQRIIENATSASGSDRPKRSGQIDAWIPADWRTPAYRLALTRGRLDIWLIATFVDPFLKLFRQFDSWETQLAARFEKSQLDADSNPNTSGRSPSH
jgi:NAD(P)H-quinone oxidoreductase subunit 5